MPQRIVNGRVIGACKLPSPYAHLHSPKLKMFLKAGAIPASPASRDWTGPAISVIENIEGNDNYGDCVFAEDAHYIGVVTGNANTLYAYTAQQALADYSAETGFNAADPNTDQGADPIADLNYRVTHGYADGSKDAGWALVDATNQAEVEFAINEFGNIKMWFGIPDAIVNAMPQASGFVWDVDAGDSDQNNGHCIGSYGYNPTEILAVAVTKQGVIVSTWGMLGLITWAALAKWFVPAANGGLATRVSMNWVNKQKGQTPSGLNVAGLITAFNVYFGGNLPVPATPPTPPTPTPTPTPTPSPAPAVTLAEAQSWAQQGIAAQSHWILTSNQAVHAAQAGLAAGWPKS